MAFSNESSAGLLLKPEFSHDASDQAQASDVFSHSGKSAQRKRFEPAPTLATITSLVCLGLGICVITSRLRIAWTFGFNGQIIAVGFLLGIMNLCMGMVLPHALLLLEARFGSSILQNYELLLTGRVFTHKATLIWRIVLAILIALPLGLSVAYKRFAGGFVTAPVKYMGDMEYDIGFARVDSWAPPNNALYLFSTSMGPFISASQNPKGTELSKSTTFPLAFGYNTLLLDDSSAAMLDIPTNATIANIQAHRLKPNESWDLTATVQAYVAAIDTESDFRTNNDTWTRAVSSSSDPSSVGDFGLYSMFAFEGLMALGLMPSDDNNACFISLYNTSSSYELPVRRYDKTNEEELERFRASAFKFKISRAKCRGHWQITTAGMALIDGDCDKDSFAESAVLQGQSMTPFAYDILPSASHSYRGFARGDPALMPWLNATHAVSVVTSYWSRAVYMIHNQGLSTSRWSGPYIPSPQSCTSTRPALTDEMGLYVVLAIQPMITLIALLITAWLWHVPLSRGFGLISILSGFNPLKSSPVRGAGLSGELDRRAVLELAIIESRGDRAGPLSAGVQCRILAPSEHLSGVASELAIGQKYG